MDYKEIKNGKEAFQYMGQVKDGRKTHRSIATLGEYCHSFKPISTG